MNFGGPVWHASCRGRDRKASQDLARRALFGVGDAKLGEWWEDGSRTIMHLRRRLSVSEAQGFVLRDIRGTAEEHERMATLLAEAPILAQLFSHTQTEVSARREEAT